MKTAEILHRGLEPVEEMEEIAVPSPEKVRRGTINYYKFKMEKQAEVIRNLQKQLQQPVDPNLIPQLATVKKITESGPSLRVDEGSGHNQGEGKAGRGGEPEDREERKGETSKNRSDGDFRAVRNKKGCRCASPKCRAAGLKRCPHCEDILRSKCSKKARRNAVSEIALTPEATSEVTSEETPEVTPGLWDPIM